LYAANIFEKRAGLTKGNLSAMLRALDWFVLQKVQVVNLSIVGGLNKIMRMALTKIKEKGIIIVAAAGNNGAKAAPVWPAADPSVLAVTAIDYRFGVYRQANRGSYIDFAAPGVAIETETPDGKKQQSGTSFATPFITAVVAIHLQLGFEPDVDLLRKSMQRYAQDLGKKGKDATYGWGLVRVKPSCG
ncbi:MAG: S8 family serine peptidase, partial [Alphaproteobacteria bacterium]|nr:S8 family serine peptidase [Alphaproteobacteria bacterium]